MLTKLIRKSERLTFWTTTGIVDRAPWTRRARRIDSVELIPFDYSYVICGDRMNLSQANHFRPSDGSRFIFLPTTSTPVCFQRRHSYSWAAPTLFPCSSSSAATLPASLLRSSPLAALPACLFLATVPSPVSPPLPSVGLPGQAREGNGRN